MNRKALLMLLVLAAAAATVTAQEDGETATEVFTDSVAVRIVNVDVFVTDKKGRSIHGLTPEDFELYEDGRRVEIANFFVAEAGAEPSATTVTAGLPTAVDGVEPEPTTRSSGSRVPNLIVYVDNLNLRQGGRLRVLADLRTFLEQNVDDGTRVMVAVHGRQGLQPLLEPTTDRKRVLEALDSVEAMTAEGFREDLDRQALLREIRDLYYQYADIPNIAENPCQLAAGEFNFAVENYARDRMAQNEVTARGMSILIGALAGLPGLKTLVYVSDGLPQFAGTEMFAYLADLCPEASSRFTANYNRFDSSRIFDRVTQQANANQVTIHTLEARGLTTSTGASVESEGRFLGRDFRPSSGNDRIRQANTQTTLFQLAEDTGGRAVLNANEFAQDLVEIGADSRNYYSLGFQARERGDGRVHRLRVELVDPKYRFRYRKSYRDKAVEETLVERTLGALIFNLEDNPLAARVEVTQVPAEAGGTEVRLLVSIPRDHLALIPGADNRQGTLRLVLTARDSGNSLQPIKQKRVPVIAEGLVDDGAEGVAQLEIGIELEPGDHELALAIRDEVTSTTSFLRRAVRVEG